MKMISILFVFLFGCICCEITLAAFSGGSNSPSSTSQDDGGIISERIVKSPWNPDNLLPDDIRCYCNLPVCITTSYMCRTGRTAGGCFSEIRETGEDPETSRHGCVELLPDEYDQKVKCDNAPRKHKKPITANKRETLMLCCQEDMCNHVDNQKRFRQLNVTTESNDTDRMPPSPIQITSSNYNNNEFWFKVATILVPVLGVIIVVILVFFAVRMLKNDSNFDGSSKLGSPGGGMGQRKIDHEYEANSNHTPLLKPQHTGAYNPAVAGPNQLNFHLQINSMPAPAPTTAMSGMMQAPPPQSTNCDKKNETQAKINQLMHLEYSLLPQSYTDSSVKLTNTDVGVNSMYRNVNLSLSQNHRNRDTSDKIYEKEVLNPVTVNWAGSAGSGSYGM